MTDEFSCHVKFVWGKQIQFEKKSSNTVKYASNYSSLLCHGLFSNQHRFPGTSPVNPVTSAERSITKPDEGLTQYKVAVVAAVIVKLEVAQPLYFLLEFMY